MVRKSKLKIGGCYKELDDSIKQLNQQLTTLKAS